MGRGGGGRGGGKLLGDQDFLINRENNTFANTWTVQMAKFPEISHFFNQHDSSLGRYVNTMSRKSLEIQA